MSSTSFFFSICSSTSVITLLIGGIRVAATISCFNRPQSTRRKAILQSGEQWHILCVHCLWNIPLPSKFTEDPGFIHLLIEPVPDRNLADSAEVRHGLALLWHIMGPGLDKAWLLIEDDTRWLPRWGQPVLEAVILSRSQNHLCDWILS